MGKTILKWTANALFSILGWIIVQIAKALGWTVAQGIKEAIRHPRSSAAALLTGASVFVLGWETAVTLVGIAFLSGSIWKAAHPETFEKFVLRFLRAWLRRWWNYRRVWDTVMSRCGLVVEHDKTVYVPTLQDVQAGEYWDHLVVKLEVGQELSDFESAVGKLRTAFEVDRITLTEITARTLRLDLMRKDPLVEPVDASPIPACVEDIDFTALPIGLCEDLTPYTLSVVGGHTSTAGTSGSGKAGVGWNVLRCLAPALAAGLVRPVGIDPKAVELRQGLELFANATQLDADGHRSGDYAIKPQETLNLLDRLVAEMDARNEAMGGAGERSHVPTVDNPLVLVLVDELAPLLDLWEPRSLRDKITDRLSLLLTQGRSAGFIVLGAIQEPTKDVFKVRDLFGRKIALRLLTEAHNDAALVEDASDRGAECHRIPESLPGVLYQLLTGQSRATRARLGHVTDDHIAELVAYVKVHRNVTHLDSRRQAAANREAA